MAELAEMYYKEDAVLPDPMSGIQVSHLCDIQYDEKAEIEIEHEFKGAQPLTVPHHQGPHPTTGPRARLLPYLLSPRSHERVIRITPDTLLLRDKFPKAKVHLLLLPRWTPHRDFHPNDSFADPDFLSVVKKEAASALPIAIELLQGIIKREKSKRMLSRHTIANGNFGSILDKSKQVTADDFQIGIHAHPSQLHLHVHIISKDMVSNSLIDVRHYASFTTPFLIPLADFPLAPDDIRRDVEYQNGNIFRVDCICPKCGKDYNHDFAKLKTHLEKEWALWRDEH